MDTVSDSDADDESKSNCTWSEQVNEFLESPPLDAECAGDAQNSLVLRRTERNRYKGVHEKSLTGVTSNKQRILQVVFAAFIDLMCEAVPKETREQLRSVLNRTVIQCRLIPAAYLSDDLIPLRSAFVNRIAQLVSHNFNISTNIENPLSFRDSPANLFFPSRYRSDFEEIRMLGKGGFGTVFLVRSRIDNCNYAIKKIPFSLVRNSQMLKAVNEVRLLASLQHANIVRYFGAWAEIDSVQTPLLALPNANIQEVRNCSESENQRTVRLLMLDDNNSAEGDCCEEIKQTKSHCCLREDTLEDTSETESWQKSASLKNTERKRVPSKFWTNEASSSSSSIPSTHPSFSTSSCRHLSTANSTDNTSGSTDNSIMKNSRVLAIQRSELLRTNQIQRNSFLNEATMFVQMELCSRTLNDYIEFRNSSVIHRKVDCNFNVSVLKQLFSALNYIHSKNIIHRDIKPCNVFLRDHKTYSSAASSSSLSSQVRVLIGDFGLACHDLDRFDTTTTKSRVIDECDNTTEHLSSLFVSSSTKPTNQRTDMQHSIAVGTSTYAAPEQLTSTDYDCSVDIYSAGIIFYELYQPFTTAMERVKAITNLRDGNFDEGFISNWPNESSLIVSLCQSQPNERPRAFEVLNKIDCFVECDNDVDSLKEEISSLKETLRNKNERIQQLEARIKSLSRLCQQYNVPICDLN